MYVPKLHMQSQMGRIGMESTASRQEISQPRADMTIEQPSAKMDIHTKNAVLHIDQSQAWTDAGLKSVKQMIQEHAQQGYQAFLDGTGRRASQGTEMMRIENQGNPIVQQAEANAYKALKQLGITFIPGNFSVRFDYEPGYVDIEVTPEKPRINAMARPVEMSHVPGDLSIYMEQYSSLEIDVDPQFFERI